MMKNGWYKFDHIGIMVKPGNLEKVMEFYKNLFGFELPKTGPYSKVVDMGSWKYCLISSKGSGKEETFIEFFEPPSEASYHTDLLKGEGTIVELCITVDNIEQWYDKLKKMGITPLDLNGNPLVDKKYDGVPTGSKFFYLPRSVTFGTTIEILERPGQPYRPHSE
jgi:catechol 2,3-dioxygenase-like lactoylglutathione lyase family enzyme